MKLGTLRFALVIALFPFFSLAQPKDKKQSQGISLDFGSYRDRYLYPITNLRYESPWLSKIPFRVHARLRSYGTLYVVSTYAYDVTPLIEAKLKSMGSHYFYTGAGFDLRLRFLKDERSEAKTSLEPLVSVGYGFKNEQWEIRFPVWTRWYSNGIAFTILPEVGYQIKAFQPFMRFEGSFLKIYTYPTTELRYDVFLGVKYDF